MPDILSFTNILLSATGDVLLFVGLVGEIRYAKLTENTTQKLFWWGIIFMVFIFIFSFSSFTITLILQARGINVSTTVINNIVALAFFTGGIWMSSMILLEYRIVHNAEEKNADTQLIKELEEKRNALEKIVVERTSDLASKVEEMKKVQNKLIQDELTMVKVKKEITELEIKKL